MGASWESYRHSCSGRNYVVVEHTSDSTIINGITTGTMHSWRTVQDGTTGEVVREFRPAPNCYAPNAYDFAEGQQWLEKLSRDVLLNQESFYGNSGITTWSTNSNMTYVNHSNISVSNHNHSNITAMATPPAPLAQDEEHDMAQRQDFTFPYTGAEIAASLERKAAKLDAQQAPRVQIDRATAELLGYAGDTRYTELVKEKQELLDRKNTRFAKEAVELRKEALPYAKAAKGGFEIDLEDIEHFGLNDEDAPMKKTRKPRTPRVTEPLEEAVSA